MLIIIRTVVLYLIVYIVVRMMGKREIGELQPYEFVLTFLAADMVAAPMEDMGTPLLYGILPVLTLLTLHNIISFVAIKSTFMRKIISGNPCILISKGVIQEETLLKTKFNISDLLTQLRTKDIFDISDVYYAILETNGEISVMLKTEISPVSKQDLAIESEQKDISYTLISDGKILQDNLEKVNKSSQWLMQELKKEGCTKVEDIFLVEYIPKKQMFIQTKKPNVKTISINTD